MRQGLSTLCGEAFANKLLCDAAPAACQMSFYPDTSATKHAVPRVCRLYESICPLSEELVARLTCHMEPFCITQDLAFSRCQARAGPWRSYFIGVVGTFAPDEDDVLWPNQVMLGPVVDPARMGENL